MGTVATILEVPVELEAAVMAGLGTRIDGVVVADPYSRFKRARPSREHPGRSLLAMAAVSPPARRDTLPAVAGVEGYLVDLLDVDAHAALIGHLVDDAVLTTDLEAAQGLASNGWAGTIVTRKGERLDAGALYTVGSAGTDAGPLGRRREIKTLSERLETLLEQHAALEGRLDTTRESQQTARNALDAARTALQQAEILKSTTRKDFIEQLEREHQRAEQMAQRFRDELEQVDVYINEAVQTEADATLALKTAEDNRGDRQKAMADAEERVRSCEAARDAAVSAVHDAKARAMGRNERLLTLKTLLSRLDRQINEIQVRRDRVVLGGGCRAAAHRA